MTGVVALVTGAAYGLGRATVQHLISSGAEAVIAFDYEFKHKFNDNKVIEITGNASHEADVNIAIDVCRQKFGRLDVLINCAFFELNKELKSQSISLKEFSNILELNTNSAFNTIRLAVGLMGDKQAINGLRGLIINTIFIPTLEEQRKGKPCELNLSESIALSTSAGAINSMTLPLARDLGRQGIRCVAIEVPVKSVKYCQTFDLAKSFVHLIKKVIENQMINGNVISLNNGLIDKSACKL